MNRLLLIFLFFPLMVLAQSKTVSGVVNDENGSPLPGATVQLKGSDSIGAISDFDGNFSINIPSENNQVLIFSYIGYTDQEVDVTNQSNLNIQLLPDTEALEEVVVIGYGTVLKRDLTGSVSSIKVDEEISRQSSTVDQLLQGRASGVQVTQNAANPNSGVSVRIRGTNSLRGNNEPLYVVDGVIISSAGEDVMSVDGDGQGNTGQDAQSGLNGINPRDIESIEVLKDASATAIYGSRGANGVVLITTKSGNDENNGKVSAYINTSLTEINNTIEVLDAFNYAEYVNAYQDLQGYNQRFQVIGNQIYRFQLDADGNPTDVPEVDPQELYNWQEEIYQTGVSHNFGVSMTGSNDRGNYYVSVGGNEMNGLIRSSKFKTSDIRVNLNYDINEKLRLEGRFSAFLSKSNFAEGGDKVGGEGSFVQQTVVYGPVLDNQFFQEQRDSGISNPLTFVNDFTDKSKENRFLASLALKYKFNIPGLQYEFRIGGNLRDKTRNRFYGVTTFVGRNTNGLYQQMKLNALSYQVNNFLRYNRNINRNHRVNATLGITYDVRDVENTRYAVEDFITPVLGSLQPFLGQVVSQPLLVMANDVKIFSVLGRVNYTLKNKYVLTASFRRDGVSKFSGDLKYGVFPSFAARWRAGSEKFIQDLNLFSSLAVRAGWGEIGNHGVGPYGTISNYGGSSLYGSSGNGTVVPVYLTNIANKDLTWETTEQTNIGIDFGFLNGKISGTIDAYEKTTKDLLQRAPIAPSSGFTQALINRGQMTNKGLEIGLDITAVDSDDFNFSLGGNISFNETEIGNLGLPEGEVYMPNGDGTYSLSNQIYYAGNQASRGNAIKFPINVFMSGQPTGMFFGWKTDGIFQNGDQVYRWLRGNGAEVQPGDIKVVDMNGDGVINLDDRTLIGDPNPDFIYNFSLNFSYKRFSVTTLFNGVVGNDIANLNQYRYGWAEGTSRNILADSWNNRWTAENTSGTYPRLGYKTTLYPAMMDYVVEDGTYLRLKNITLNYDIPINNSTLIDSANVYVTGQNLFTWTNYSGYDPEITSFMYDGLVLGADWNNKPNSKTYLVGLNLTF